MSGRIDQRKFNSAETIEKKRAAVMKDHSKNAFLPKKKKDADHMAECLERAVALGLANDAANGEKETGVDVIRHNRWSVYHHVRAAKLG